jgi:hypothetical protein
MNARCLPLVVSAGMLVSGCSAPPEQAAPVPSASAAPSEAGLPAGWRWESFGGVEVGVPPRRPDDGPPQRRRGDRAGGRRPAPPHRGDGDEMLVLLLDRRHQVVVRYSGCDHNGIDDGVTVRALTRAAVAPLLAGPNRPWEFGGGTEKADALGY